MEMVTLSSKGQIVIPAGVRKRMKLKVKDRLMIEEEEGGILLKPVVKLSTMSGRYRTPGGTSALRAMRAKDERDWIERISGMDKRHSGR
jgi:AbrB family looped-hinge helix DNA binding protein